MGWRQAAWQDFLDRSPGPSLNLLRWISSAPVPPLRRCSGVGGSDCVCIYCNPPYNGERPRQVLQHEARADHTDSS